MKHVPRFVSLSTCLLLTAGYLSLGSAIAQPSPAAATTGDHTVEARLRVATHHSQRPAGGTGRSKKRTGRPFQVRKLDPKEEADLKKQFFDEINELSKDFHIRALDRELTPGAGMSLDKYLIIPKNPKTSPKRAIELAETLYKTAYDAVTAPAPTPVTNPAMNAKKPPIVALPVWFWAQGAQPVEASVSAEGYTMRVTATPRAVRWTAEDKTSAFCGHLGTPWTPGANPQNACTYTYAEPKTGENAVVSLGWVTRTSYTFEGQPLNSPAFPATTFATWADVNLSVYERHALSS